MSRLFSIIVGLFVLTFSAAYGQLPGGLSARDPNEPEFMEKAWKSTTTLNEANAGTYVMVPVKVSFDTEQAILSNVQGDANFQVVKAETQVVAGLKYILEVLFGESSCKKGEVALSDVNKSNCELRANGNRALYKVELWEKAWENFQQFTVSKIRDVAAGENI
ncbi:cystatin domain protein [Oesophagostomum dentatum]|uniref:Cystatin domain protein n=1 Tax=Oesophagostomum dentatum TaxID=61180 RepID=A0A0B1T9T4_OESDE|nr:cystatin domain protein [Oesophagostomum dentatum]